MKRLRITYLDGTEELVEYYGYTELYEGVLAVDLDSTSYGPRRRRRWPLASVRSWEDVA